MMLCVCICNALVLVKINIYKSILNNTNYKMAEQQDSMKEGIKMDVAAACVKNLEDLLNKGIKAGAYDMKDIHLMYECFVGVVTVVNACDKYQKELMHLANQRELLEQAEQK